MNIGQVTNDLDAFAVTDLAAAPTYVTATLNGGGKITAETDIGNVTFRPLK